MEDRLRRGKAALDAGADVVTLVNHPETVTALARQAGRRLLECHVDDCLVAEPIDAIARFARAVD